MQRVLSHVASDEDWQPSTAAALQHRLPAEPGSSADGPGHVPPLLFVTVGASTRFISSAPARPADGPPPPKPPRPTRKKRHLATTANCGASVHLRTSVSGTLRMSRRTPAAPGDRAATQLGKPAKINPRPTQPGGGRRPPWPWWTKPAFSHAHHGPTETGPTDGNRNRPKGMEGASVVACSSATHAGHQWPVTAAAQQSIGGGPAPGCGWPGCNCVGVGERPFACPLRRCVQQPAGFWLRAQQGLTDAGSLPQVTILMVWSLFSLVWLLGHGGCIAAGLIAWLTATGTRPRRSAWVRQPGLFGHNGCATVCTFRPLCGLWSPSSLPRQSPVSLLLRLRRKPS